MRRDSISLVVRRLEQEKWITKASFDPGGGFFWICRSGGVRGSMSNLAMPTLSMVSM